MKEKILNIEEETSKKEAAHQPDIVAEQVATAGKRLESGKIAEQKDAKELEKAHQEISETFGGQKLKKAWENSDFEQIFASFYEKFEDNEFKSAVESFFRS